MKKTIIIFITLFLIKSASYAQVYKELLDSAELYYTQDRYFEAYDNFRAAKTYGKKVPSIVLKAEKGMDKSIAKIKRQEERSDSLLKVADVALLKAERMQQRMETAIFDKAVKEQYKDWKGYVNYETEYERNKILKKIKHLDFSANALIRLPKEINDCPNLSKLNLLQNNDIKWDENLKKLSGLNNLNEIFVSVYDLDNIPKEYHNKITGIELLKTGLKEIPLNILQQKQLKYLDISGEYKNDNFINVLPPELFKLQYLEHLNLNRCNIEQLPQEIGKLTNLTELYLSWNKFKTIPNQVENLLKLQKLNINFNQLSVISQSIFKLKNLTELALTYNTIAVIPKEISNLTKLEVLNLSFNNNIEIVPTQIGSLVNLEILNLSINKINSIPKEIGNLTKLTILELGGNQLTTLPPEIGNLKNITILSLWSNKLTALPNEICKLSNLKEILLVGNKLTTLPSEFGNFKNLTSLDLTNNKLTELPESIKNLENLTVIFMVMNNFSEGERQKIKTYLPNCKLLF